MGVCSSQKQSQNSIPTQIAEQDKPNQEPKLHSVMTTNLPREKVNNPRAVKFQLPQIRSINSMTHIVQVWSGSFTQNYSCVNENVVNQIRDHFNIQNYVIQHNITGDIKAVELIKKEEETLKYIKWLTDNQIKNLHIQQVLEIYKDKKQIQLVQEHVGEGQLSQLIENGPLHENIVCLIIDQIISTLQYLHRNQFYHNRLSLLSFCLLKSQNNFFLKLVDLRQAYLKEKGKFKSYFSNYLSPEKLLASGVEEYTEAADCWSIGAIAYELLTGTVAVDNSDIKERPKTDEECKAVLDKYENIDFSLLSNCSQGAQSFVKNLLTFSSSTRMKLDSCGLSNWIFQSKLLYSSQVQQRRIYSDRNIQSVQLKQSRPQYLADCLLMYMIQKYAKEFKFQIDCIIEKQGISKEDPINSTQIKEIYKRYYDRFDVSTLMKNNFNCERLESVSYQKLLIATVDKDKLLQESHIQQGFLELQNNKGQISTKSILKFVQADKEKLKEDVKQIKSVKKFGFDQFKEILQVV